MSLLLLLAMLNTPPPSTNVVGAYCTRTSQCGHNEVCMVTDRNKWGGKCVKIQK